jgi:hypothetical protein
MIKNLNHTEELSISLLNVRKLVFYEENPIKVAYLDNKLSLGLLAI